MYPHFNNMGKQTYIYIIVCLISFSSYSQVTGKVVDKETLQPLPNVFVKEENGLQWTLTDKEGRFSLATTSFPTTVRYHLLGKIDVVITYTTAPKTQLILLSEDNLKIDEIVVLAKRKKQSTGSNLVLGKQAIQLVQAQSLADVMQLIPGKSISEANLHQRQILTLRSAIFSATSKFNEQQGLGNFNDTHLINNAFGVGYVIDGVPMNNNVNLSGNRGTRFGLFANLTDNNSVGIGLDLKNLSLDNIESIDIVQGISSARYGDHNTGLIKINRAHGYTPFRIHSTLRGGSYGVTFTKGYELPKDYGFINIGLDYLKSNRDPRTSLSQFDRVNINTSWSYKRENRFSNRLTLSYGQHLNADNSEITSTSERRKRVDNKRIRISNTNTIYTNNKWLDQLSSTFSIDYSDNNTFNSIFQNNGGEPILNGLTTGTYEAGYTPVAFRAIENIENKPFSFFSRLEATKEVQAANTKYIFHLGATFGVDKNFGRGNYSDTDVHLHNSPSSSGKAGFRNINFNNIVPADVKFSAYATTNIRSILFGKKWITELGLRYDNYNKQATLSPRLNSILHLNKRFKTRLGVGLFAKSPSLQTLFPGKVYYDFLLADFRTNQYSFALAHTFVREYKTPNIKPSKTVKIETGLDYTDRFWNASLTGYFNRQYDGFTSLRNFEIAQLPVMQYTFHPNRKPDYVQVGEENVLLDYSRPTNALTSTNFGIELLGHTRKIQSINTSFTINAAYRYTKAATNLPQYQKSTDQTSVPFIGLHTPIPRIYQTINSSVTATHHISSIGLVITVTAEQFIMAKNSVAGAVLYPFAYYDRDLNYFTIPESQRTDPKYIPIRRNASAGLSFQSDIPSMFTNYHLRVAKEFDNGLRCSFYAVNFLNHLPKVELVNSNSSLTIKELNRPISFGGSITYKF